MDADEEDDEDEEDEDDVASCHEDTDDEDWKYRMRGGDIDDCDGLWDPWWADERGDEQYFLQQHGYTASYRAWKFAELEEEHDDGVYLTRKVGKVEYWRDAYLRLFDEALDERQRRRACLKDLKYAVDWIAELEAVEDEVGDTSDSQKALTEELMIKHQAMTELACSMDSPELMLAWKEVLKAWNKRSQCMK